MLIAFGIYRNSVVNGELQNNGVVTDAKITDFKFLHRSTYEIEYEYFVDNKKYVDTRTTSFFECSNGEKGCKGKIFKVTYSSMNPKINRIDLGRYNKYKKNNGSSDF